jgi:surface protein
MLIFFPLFFPPILIVGLVCSCGAVFYRAEAFNSDLSAWNVGNVMSMFQSTYIVSPFFKIGVFLFGCFYFPLSFFGAH